MKFFKKYKSELIFGGIALMAGALAFVITLNVYPLINKPEDISQVVSNAKENNIVSNEVKNNIAEQKIKEQAERIKAELAMLNQNKDKLTEEIKVAENNVVKVSEPVIIEDIVENKSAIETVEIQEQETVEIVINEPIIEKENEQELIDEPYVEAMSNNVEQSMELPVSGEVILEFAKDKLVYSETLEEWITHDGIDIAAEEASPVKCALDGVVESVKMDPRYGNTIIVKHNDSLKTVYSNLSTLELVYVGKSVKKGEIISGVGAGFGFESKEGPHVHFEVIENGVVVEP